MDWKDFYLAERESHDIIIAKKIYVHLTGNITTALLLSQIVYWFLPGKNGQSKIRIKKDDKEWIAKKRTDWFDECCLTVFQYDKAINILKEMGLVETKIYKFAGEPTTHISLLKDNFLKAVEKYYDSIEE